MVYPSITPEFMAGLCNGITQAVSGHPLDTIKVLQQNNKNWNTLKFKELMRGLQYPLTYKIITKSITFDLNNKIDVKNDFIRGAITGVYLTPITHALDLYKIKRQHGLNIHSINLYDFLNYRALLCTLARDTIAYSLYIPVYIRLRNKDYNPFIAGGIAGLVNWSASYPIDVIRTRQIIHNKNTIKKSINMGSLKNGYIPCVLRAMLTSSIGFFVFEQSLYFIKSNNLIYK
jgi:hypothetical protein|tara:strand:+ start:316 stop:1008 length:693 start_codon:yes stop_codon:yes gene_type:complete